MNWFRRRPRLGRSSVKEAFDNLPSGICFADRNGLIILCNRQMHSLCWDLLGTDLQHLEELRRALKSPQPGVTAAEVYRAVSARLEAAGCDPLPHHAGHGVGCSWYEPPYFIPGCTTPLQAGMIVTLEPGVYLRDLFGVRIENNYLIEANGCRALFGGLTELDDNTVGG